MKRAEFQKVKLHILENQSAHKLQTVYNQHYSVSDLFAVGGGGGIHIPLLHCYLPETQYCGSPQGQSFRTDTLC